MYKNCFPVITNLFFFSILYGNVMTLTQARVRPERAIDDQAPDPGTHRGSRGAYH